MNFSESRIRHFLGRLNWRWVHLPAAFVLIALSLHVWNNPSNLEVSITTTLPPGVKTTLYYTKGHRLFKDSQSIQHINEQFRESTQTYTVRTWATVRQLRWDPMEYEGRLSLRRVDVSNQISHWTLQAPQIGQATHLYGSGPPPGMAFACKPAPHPTGHLDSACLENLARVSLAHLVLVLDGFVVGKQDPTKWETLVGWVHRASVGLGLLGLQC